MNANVGTTPIGLFDPIRLRELQLANRLVVSPMCQYSAVEGTAQPWHWFHLGSLAMSGAGLVITEATAVEPRGRITPDCLGLYSDENEAALTRLVADIHRYEGTARVGVQLAHAGRKASTRKTWELSKGSVVPHEEGGWDVVGPSAIAYTTDWPVPAEMDGDELARVRDAFVDSARRAERCGFDLLEVHAAHGYLLHSFLSPITNRRTDAYGGDMTGRMRYFMEVIAAMRDAWPTHKPMGVRMNGSDWMDGGLTLDDAVTVAAALRDIGIDYVTPSGGNTAPGVKYPPAEPGYMVHFAERVRREAGIRTMTVGIVTHPEQADAIVRDGKADMVAVARGFLDNPRWGWHAAAALDREVERPPQYGRVAPQSWPFYRSVHGTGPSAGAGAMTHASRD